MNKFLKDNWLWMLLPIALVLGGLALFQFLQSDGDDDQPHIYNLYG